MKSLVYFEIVVFGIYENVEVMVFMHEDVDLILGLPRRSVSTLEKVPLRILLKMTLRSTLLVVQLAFSLAPAAGGVLRAPLETLPSPLPINAMFPRNATSLDVRRNQRAPWTAAERDLEDKERKKRILEQRERARRKIESIQPDLSQLKLLSEDEVTQAVKDDQPWARRLWGGSSSNDAVELADASQYYDKWQQAYRMLGGFIDCDHDKDGEDNHSGDNDNEANENGCSRWMLWAAVSRHPRADLTISSSSNVNVAVH